MKVNGSEGLGLLAQIAEDWQANGRDWTRPGFQAVAVHRFGNWRMRLQPKLVRAPFSVIYRALYRGVRNFYGIELPYTTLVGRRVVIEHQGGIVIHGNAVIGDDCILRHNVTLGNRKRDRPIEAPRLGNGVNVGAGAKILGEIVIGDGAQIGANAVVCADVPEGAIAVGIPARVIERRDQPGGGARAVSSADGRTAPHGAS
jgi:serine O-acetyltransferase